MTLRFDRFEITDRAVTLWFVSFDPGGGKPNDYSVTVTDAEIAAATTAPDLRDLVEARLRRKLRGAGLSARLDELIGHEVRL